MRLNPALKGRAKLRRRSAADFRATAYCSVHAFDDVRLELREGADVADAVPGVGVAGRLALGLVAFEEARHEELFGQRRQAHAPRLAVADDARGVLRVHDLDH